MSEEIPEAGSNMSEEIPEAESHMSEEIPEDVRSEWIVIGISGVTCGGKTTLANRLKQVLRPVYLFHQDAYFLPDSSARHVRVRSLEHNNYDVLSSLDMHALHRDLHAVLQHHARAPAVSLAPDAGTYQMPGKKFLVIEGFTVLNYPPINEMCDFRYYLVLEYGECMSRRVLRTYSPPDVPGYFDLCVWPEHCRYRAQIESDPRVRILDGKDPKVFEQVMSDLCEAGLTPQHP